MGLLILEFFLTSLTNPKPEVYFSLTTDKT